MPTYSDETERLRELHEDYAWQVNAAVSEGREDLIGRLSDEYLLKAMQLMAGERPLTGQESAPASFGSRQRPARTLRARWWRRRR